MNKILETNFSKPNKKLSDLNKLFKKNNNNINRFLY